MNDFPAWLFEFSEKAKLAFGRETGFFQEFALRGREQILAGRGEPLRDRPGAVVLPRPEGPTGMHEKEFGRVSLAAIEQNPCTDLLHPGTLAPWAPAKNLFSNRAVRLKTKAVRA
jgi:hypothetical protein